MNLHQSSPNPWVTLLLLPAWLLLVVLTPASCSRTTTSGTAQPDPAMTLKVGFQLAMFAATSAELVALEEGNASICAAATTATAVVGVAHQVAGELLEQGVPELGTVAIPSLEVDASSCLALGLGPPAVDLDTADRVRGVLMGVEVSVRTATLIVCQEHPGTDACRAMGVAGVVAGTSRNVYAAVLEALVDEARNPDGVVRVQLELGDLDAGTINPRSPATSVRALRLRQ